MSWWRAHDKSVNNRKLQRLPGELFKAWYNVNCLASANNGVVPAIEDVAFALRLTEQRAAAVLTQLVTAKLLDTDGDSFIPHDWDEHQFKSDKTDPTAPLRQKRYRDKKRNDRNATVTDTVMVKRPEAEAETDSEQSRADASAPIDEDLKRKVAALQAGISAHFLSRQQAIPNLDRCLLWLTQGYASGTILRAVEAVLKRGKKISTLDYFDGAIKDDHEKNPPASPLIDTMAGWYVIVEGTLEETCWQQHSRATTGRPMFICDQTHEGRTVRGAKKPTLFPPGFNDFGERVAPNESEDAA